MSVASRRGSAGPSLSQLSVEIDRARSARGRSDRGEPLARLLVRRANAYMDVGSLTLALTDLDQATSLHEQGGRSADRVRCMHLAATSARLSGDLDGAYRRAIQALDLAQANTAPAVSCLTELGETASAQGDPFRAAGRYAQALEQGRAAGMLKGPQAALLRRRAQALVLTGNPVKAALDLKQAVELLTIAGERVTAAQSAVELASAWTSAVGGELDTGGAIRAQALAAIEQGETLARSIDETGALADLALLRSTLALLAGDALGALEQAQLGQRLALQATQPLSYTTSTLAISQLSDRLGDRLAAYRALAVGWVTLGDLMGPEVGKSTFEPKLQGLVERWGEQEFVRVRDLYNSRSGS